MSENTPFHLYDDVALVTGGGTGLGLGIATALADAGAKVVVAGRRPEPLEAAKAQLGEDRCAFVVGDVTNPDDRARILDQTRAAFDQPVSIIVNNAGVHLKKLAAEVSDEEFQKVLSTHVNAGFALSRDAYPQLREAGCGSVIFLASMTSFLAIPKVVAYTTAKCAVVGLTRALAAEWAEHSIRVNAIAPGWIESPMLRQALDGDTAREQRILSRTPLGGFGEPSDIGHAAVYLSSPAGKFINGVVLPVDGGASVGF